MPLSQDAATALRGATVSRGAHKGQLLAKAPHYSTMAYAAWHGAMMSVNPHKASIGGIMAMSPEQKAIRQEVTEHFDSLPRATRIALQRDRLSLETLGVW